MDRAQRLSLGARLVLRQRQQRPASFAEGRGPHEGLRLRQHLVVPARTQQGVHPELLGLEAQFRQAPGLVRRRRPGPHVSERLAAPQGECLRQQVRRAIDLAQGQQLPTARDQVLELQGVDLVGREGQRVSLR